MLSNRYMFTLAIGLASLTASAAAGFVVKPTRAAMYAALAGNWVGTLEYKDYSRPDKRVTLPTKLAISYTADSSALLMYFTYDDGPGKIVQDSDRFEANAAATRVTWGTPGSTSMQQFEVSDAPSAKGVVSFVLQGEGSDNNKPATIRETFVISRDTLRILKETREVGGAFAFRHGYVMHR